MNTLDFNPATPDNRIQAPSIAGYIEAKTGIKIFRDAAEAFSEGLRDYDFSEIKKAIDDLSLANRKITIDSIKFTIGYNKRPHLVENEDYCQKCGDSGVTFVLTVGKDIIKAPFNLQGRTAYERSYPCNCEKGRQKAEKWKHDWQTVKKMHVFGYVPESPKAMAAMRKEIGC